MFNEYSDIMTVPQVAAALHIGKNKAYNLIRQRVIGSKQIGKIIRVPKQSVIDYVQSARYNISCNE